MYFIPLIILFLIASLIVVFIAKKNNKMQKESDLNLNENIDVSRPVENPKLVEAIQKLSENASMQEKNNLYKLINEATYILIVNTDKVISEKKKDNSLVLRKGSILQIETISLDNGETYLPLFTDWKHISEYTTENVETLIFPAYDAWNFLSSNKDDYKGIIINPKSDDLLLDKRQIFEFLDLLNSDRCAIEIVDILRNEFGNYSGEVNPELVAQAAGNLVGLFMFLSFNFQIDNVEPGSIVFSEEANKLGPEILNHIIYKLSNYNIDINSINVESKFVDRSELSYIDIIENIQSPVIELMKKYSFDYSKAIDITENVSAFIVSNLSAALPVNKSLGLIFYGIVQGSKTVPCKLN